MRKFLAIVLCAALGSGAMAQDTQTLADIRAEAGRLATEIAMLRQELATTGTANTAFAGASTLERVDLIEAALSQLTAKTEELEFRLNSIARDATNQLDDLNFRLCELEEGCDIGNLPPLALLGGEVSTPEAVAPTEGSGDGVVQFAEAEQADFEAARAALEAGDNERAARLFADFAQTYTGGPLTSEAHYYRGEALTAMGQPTDAARAYLDAFSGAPEGERAPDALLRLGTTLAGLGQIDRGCVMLTEVSVRFAGAPAEADAMNARQRLGCP